MLKSKIINAEWRTTLKMLWEAVVNRCSSRRVFLIFFCKLHRKAPVLGSLFTEAVAWRCSIEKVFLDIFQNLQKNTCARVSFSNKACNFIKKETLAQVFPCEFCKISKNTFSYKASSAAASFFNYIKKRLQQLLTFENNFFKEHPWWLLLKLTKELWFFCFLSVCLFCAWKVFYLN